MTYVLYREFQQLKCKCKKGFKYYNNRPEKAAGKPTLSSTRRHLSAPHNDATRFSLSSSRLRFSTHSFTVENEQTNTPVSLKYI